MKKFYLLFIAAALSPFMNLTAQTVHDVGVANLAFTPNSLEIEVGDIVRWTNNGGFHSVDGTSENWPNNPLEFGNDASSDAWVYEFTFTEEGTFLYWCGIHTDNMLGMITVGTSTGIEDASSGPVLNLFPNPVVNTLIWKWGEDQDRANTFMNLYNVEGKVVAQINLATQSQFDVSEMSGGLYFYSVVQNQNKIQSGKLLIDGK